MTTERLRQKLLRASRHAPEDPQVPHGFEWRIRLRAQQLHRPPLHDEPWAAQLERALIPCLGIMVLAAIFTLGCPAPPEPSYPALKEVLLAGLDPAPDEP